MIIDQVDGHYDEVDGDAVDDGNDEEVDDDDDEAFFVAPKSCLISLKLCTLIVHSN